MGPLALAVAATGGLAKQVTLPLPATTASVPRFTDSANLHSKLLFPSTYVWRSLPLRSSFSLSCSGKNANNEPEEFSSSDDSHADSDIPANRDARREPPNPDSGFASLSSSPGLEDLSSTARTNSESAPWKEMNMQEGGDSGLEKLQLQRSLAALSQTLAMMSATLKEVSAAVQLVAKALDSTTTYSSEAATMHRRLQASTEHASPPEPSYFQEAANGQVYGDDKEERSEEQIPVHLMERNARAHHLAYQLQQDFVQARIDGLGKPYQLAMDDFVMTCMEAHKEGFGLKELQLQLILLEGALSGAFAVRAQGYSDDPLMDEENRIRSSWVRLVYTTIAEVEERTQTGNDEVVVLDDKEPLDPSDIFVKEVITMALEEGYDLERLKLEQSVAGPTMSAGVKAMRQSHYLILLTLAKLRARG